MKKLFFFFLFFSMVGLSSLEWGKSLAKDLDFNDSLFERQWALQNRGQSLYRATGDLTQREIKGVEGIDIGLESFKKFEGDEFKEREVVVAVLDSGIDRNHPDLKGRIYRDKKLCPTKEDERTKPCSGINILEKNLNLEDDVGHGTHVAGIIAANANNFIGVAGATPKQVKILPVKVISQKTNHFVYKRKLVTDWFADGIAYALERGADVINMSIGWPKLIHTPKMKKVLSVAAERNIPIVVAAGNNNKEIPTYPCTDTHVICVGSLDNQGHISEFSNFGGKVDVLAPGEGIISTYPQESVESRVLRIRGYEVKNGTSQAAPYVTALAATLKLLYPQITYDELKARIFSSSKKIGSGRKFSQYGRIHFSKAIEEKPKSFISLNVKNLLEVKYNHRGGDFSFDLPLKSLVSDERDREVIVHFKRDDIVFLEKEKGSERKSKEIQGENQGENQEGNQDENQDSYAKKEVDLLKGEEKKLTFKGRLKDFSQDSHAHLYVTIRDKKRKKKIFYGETTLVFSRNLERESLHKEEIKGAKVSEFFYFRGKKKVSRMGRVERRKGSTPLYYLQVKGKQTPQRTILTLVKRDSKSKTWGLKDFAVGKFSQVIKVYSEDFDNDGKEDYLIYGISVDERHLIYHYLLARERGRYDQSHRFVFSLLDYKDFPLRADDLAKANFVSFSLGKGKMNLRVPAFFAVYSYSTQDNTDDLLDHVDEKIKMPHLYYLRPEGKNFKLRVYDSYSMREKLKEKLHLNSWDSLLWGKPLKSSDLKRRKGEISGLVTVGEEFERKFFSYKITNLKKDPSFELLEIPHFFIGENSSFSPLLLERKERGRLGDENIFIVQSKRERIRSLVLSEGKFWSKELTTNHYQDPIFNILGIFKDDSEDLTERNSYAHFIESRYFLHYQDFLGHSQKLRINRESSFPGVQFSEMLEPVVVTTSEGRGVPGALIDSTLIFGNRLYTMTLDEKGKMVRPMALSLDIPSSCLHLPAEVLEGETQYLFLCLEKGQGVSFRSLPLFLPPSP